MLNPRGINDGSREPGMWCFISGSVAVTGRWETPLGSPQFLEPCREWARVQGVFYFWGERLFLFLAISMLDGRLWLIHSACLVLLRSFNQPFCCAAGNWRYVSAYFTFPCFGIDKASCLTPCTGRMEQAVSTSHLWLLKGLEKLFGVQFFLQMPLMRGAAARLPYARKGQSSLALGLDGKMSSWLIIRLARLCSYSFRLFKVTGCLLF